MDDATVALLEAGQQTVNVPLKGSVVAVAACERGRDAEARTALEELDPATVPYDLYWLATMTNWAAVASHLGNAGQAERLETALRPYADQAVPFCVTPTPSVAHHLGLLAATLGRHDEAERRFGEAVAIHERIGASHFAARTRREWARVLLTRGQPGDSERAASLAESALAIYRSLGITSWARRAEAALGRRPPVQSRLAGGLTGREAEVLRLVAAGMSNKAIAVELGLSDKTIDRHMSNIFVKIGVGIRGRRRRRSPTARASSDPAPQARTSITQAGPAALASRASVESNGASRASASAT